MADECGCLICGFRGLIEQKFPGGMDDAAKRDLAHALVDICGMVLTDFTHESAKSFTRAVMASRSKGLKVDLSAQKSVH